MTTTERIEKAIALIILREPWYAGLLLRLRRKETDRVPTAATDGKSLYWNPKFIDTLSQDELIGVLIHEVLHCALLHPCRRGTRQMLPWNYACDRVVNAAVLAGGYILPDGCVPPASLNSTAEEEYQNLPTIKINIGTIGQDVKDAGVLDEVFDDANAVAVSPAEIAAIEREWREVLAASRGSVPSYLKRAVEDHLQPKVPWQDVLAEFIATKQPSPEHTWSRPHRRIAGYPGRKHIPSHTLAVCLDTSGSVDKETLEQFITELRTITSMLGTSVYALSADAQVHCVYDPGQPWDEWVGGGGTDFRPAIQWAEQHEVDALVYLTDGDGVCPPDSSVPVLWALTKSATLPFGLQVRIL